MLLFPSVQWLNAIFAGLPSQAFLEILKDSPTLLQFPEQRSDNSGLGEELLRLAETRVRLA